jgi:hypothetical protein
MSRLDYEAEIDEQQEKRLMPLSFDMSHLKVKKVSNLDHAKKTSLAAEIGQKWGIPVPRLMKAIYTKGYQFIQETFTQVQKNPTAKNPAALFLWTVKQCKVELKEVE